MRQTCGTIKFALATAITAIAFAFTVRADEAPRMAPLQTTLSSTVISGYVQTETTLTPAQNTLVPTFSEFGPGYRNLADYQRTRPTLLNPTPDSSISYNFMESDGAVTMASFVSDTPATLETGHYQFTPLTPMLQPQTEIQPAPEPSVTALGGVALGLIAFARGIGHRQIFSTRIRNRREDS